MLHRIKLNSISWIEETRRHTKVICRHHDAVLVLDGENTRSGHDGLSETIYQPRVSYISWGMVLCALDALCEPILRVIVGTLMDGICPVGVIGVISLTIRDWLILDEKHKRIMYGAAPVCGEMVHSEGKGMVSMWSEGRRASRRVSADVIPYPLARARIPLTQPSKSRRLLTLQIQQASSCLSSEPSAPTKNMSSLVGCNLCSLVHL